MEHAIGTRITLEIVEKEEGSCKGCFFADIDCSEIKQLKIGDCDWICRSDHKNVIYKQVE